MTARNAGIDRYRALRRQNTLSLDDGLADAIADLAEFDRMTAGPQDLVGALVAAMEPPDRDIFLRKYYLLESSRQIAAALGMSESAVNTRLSRGRDRLRRALRGGVLLRGDGCALRRCGDRHFLLIGIEI